MPQQPGFDVVRSFKNTLFKFRLKCKALVFTMLLLEEHSKKVQLLTLKARCKTSEQQGDCQCKLRAVKPQKGSLVSSECS